MAGSRTSFQKELDDLSNLQIPSRPATAWEIEHQIREDYVGQERAVRIVSAAAAHHLNASLDPNSSYLRENILLIGPSGSGKTQLAERVAKVAGRRYCRTDVTSLTEAGYVGEDVDSIIKGLFSPEFSDLEEEIAAVEKGIIYIDEIDKLKIYSESAEQKDVSGRGVQEELLKILDGYPVALALKRGGRKGGETRVTINPSKILIITGGVFSGIEQIVKQRKGSQLGFGSQLQKNNEFTYSSITAEDLETYGLLPELCGRLPVLVPLEKLTQAELRWILLQGSKSPVLNAQRALEMYGKKLQFTDECQDYIVKEAYHSKAGARKLSAYRTAMLELEGLMASLPQQEFIFTKEMLLNPGNYARLWKTELKLPAAKLKSVEIVRSDYELDADSETQGFVIEGKINSPAAKILEFEYIYSHKTSTEFMKFCYLARDGAEAATECSRVKSRNLEYHDSCQNLTKGDLIKGDLTKGDLIKGDLTKGDLIKRDLTKEDKSYFTEQVLDPFQNLINLKQLKQKFREEAKRAKKMRSEP